MKYKIFKLITILILLLTAISFTRAQLDLYDLLNQTAEPTPPKPTPTESLSENDVVLYWQTDSLTPPNYKGRKLPSRHSSITVFAIFLKNANPSDYAFQWYSENVMKEGGMGLTQFKFTPLIAAGNNEILLRVYGKGTNFTKLIRIPIVMPEINIYSIINNNAKIYLDQKKEYHWNPDLNINLRTEPYYFNVSVPKNLNYDWQLGNETIDEAKNMNDFNLKINYPSEEMISKDLKLTVSNQKNFEVATNKIKFRIFK